MTVCEDYCVRFFPVFMKIDLHCVFEFVCLSLHFYVWSMRIDAYMYVYRLIVSSHLLTLFSQMREKYNNSNLESTEQQLHQLAAHRDCLTTANDSVSNGDVFFFSYLISTLYLQLQLFTSLYMPEIFMFIHYAAK